MEKTWEQKTLSWIRRTRPTIYCMCRHVSASGMSRRISFYVIRNNEPFCLDWLISKVAGYVQDGRKDGLRVRGCGMDMGFAVVYDFSRKVFPKGFKYRKNEHHRNVSESNADNDGGYALKHSWL